MSTVVKDLGAVSAYAYAVEKGYTGTEAEFAELMADYAEVGQRAETAKTDAQTAKTQAETARDNAVTAKKAAETAQGKAEDAQAAAESVAESIPSDYSQLSEDVSELKEGLSAMSTATSSDVGKALKAKTVTGGKVTEWEFGEAGGGTVELDATLTDSTKAAQAKAVGDALEAKVDKTGLINVSADTVGLVKNNGVLDGTNTAWHCMYTQKLSCAEGDKFRYIGGTYTGIANSVLYFLDGTAVSQIRYPTGSDVEVVIPSGVNEVIFQSATATANDVSLYVERTNPASFEQLSDDVLAIKSSLGNKADYNFTYAVDSGTGKYISTSNATKTDTRFYYIITETIPCKEGDIYVYDGSSYVAASVLFYLDGTFVSGASYSQKTTITIPSGVNGVRFQSARMEEVALTVTRLNPSTVSDILEGTNAKGNQLWMMTANGAKWADYATDNPFANKMDYVSIFDDESLYSLTTDTKWFCSGTTLPSHAFIKKVRFKSSASGSGQIIVATSEFITNRYMMNVKVWDVDYVEGWNEVEINFSTGEHTDYLLGHKNLSVLYCDYTTVSSNVEAKYTFGNGTYYDSNASTGTDAENVRFAFGTHQSGGNYKVCHAFDAEIYTGVYPTDHDIINNDVPLFDGSLLPKYKVINGTIGYIGRWYDYNDGTDTYKVASADGAYVCFKVSGSTSVTITWGGNFNVNSCIRYRLDNGDYIRTDVIAEGNTIAIPDTDEHIVQVIMDGINSDNHYTVGNGIGIKSITADGEMKAIAPMNKKIIFFGDSLTRGVRALGTETTEIPNTNSAELSYGWYTSRFLNAVPILTGYGSSGIESNGEFSKCINAINYVVSGIESDDLDVDLIVINHGHNDTGTASATFIADYGAVLDRFMTKFPGVPVICLTPFNHRFESEIKTCADARSWCYYINATPWYLERYYADGPGHLLAAGAEVCGRLLAESIKQLGLM